MAIVACAPGVKEKGNWKAYIYLAYSKAIFLPGSVLWPIGLFTMWYILGAWIIANAPIPLVINSPIIINED